jgi:hypothetical protein
MRASLLILAAACATQNAAGSGNVTMTSNVDYRSPPLSFSIGPGHVRSQGNELDAVMDKDCVRGEMAGEPLDLCREGKEGDVAQKWAGTSGEITIKPVDNGTAFEVQGYVTLAALRSYDVTQTVRAGEGKGWDELRRQPILLVVARTATDLNALRRRHRPGI